MTDVRAEFEAALEGIGAAADLRLDQYGGNWTYSQWPTEFAFRAYKAARALYDAKAGDEEFEEALDQYGGGRAFIGAGGHTTEICKQARSRVLALYRARPATAPSCVNCDAATSPEWHTVCDGCFTYRLPLRGEREIADEIKGIVHDAGVIHAELTARKIAAAIRRRGDGTSRS